MSIEEIAKLFLGIPFDLAVGFASGYFWARSKQKSLYRKALPDEKKADSLAWDDLTSGSAIALGHGVTGYIAKVDGDYWWWLSRGGRSIVEGPASDAIGARFAVLQTAKDFALSASELR